MHDIAPCTLNGAEQSNHPQWEGTVPLAKLLQNVYKSYDSTVKILDASQNLTLESDCRDIKDSYQNEALALFAENNELFNLQTDLHVLFESSQFEDTIYSFGKPIESISPIYTGEFNINGVKHMYFAYSTFATSSLTDKMVVPVTHPDLNDMNIHSAIGR